MNIVFAIDDVQATRVDKVMGKVTIAGWCFDKSGDAVDLEVEINGNKEAAEIKRIIRSDVSKVYNNDQALKAGFIIEVLIREREHFQLLTVSGYTKNSNQTIYQLTDSDFKKYLEKRVEYNIDEEFINNNNITIRGWAFSLYNSEMQYSVYDESGNKIDSTINHIYRGDVNGIYFKDDRETKHGFNITFRAGTIQEYTIEIDDGIEKITHVGKISHLLKVQRKKIKAQSLSHMFMKTFSFKLLLDDMAYLFHNGRDKYHLHLAGRYGKEYIYYDLWYKAHRSTRKELKQQKGTKFDYEPKISIIVPAYKTPEKYLREMIESVIMQTYKNWELCISNGGKDDYKVHEIVHSYLNTEKRIKYINLKKNMRISENTNAALTLSTGDFIALLDHDDLLAPNALYEAVKIINENKNIELIYTDEDKITMNSEENFDPHFKPDFNLDFLHSCNYICHFLIVKREIVESVGEFRSEFDGSQDYDFILRCIEKTKEIYHIPQILYHWRAHPESTAEKPENKMYCYDAAQKAIQAHLQRRNIHAITKKRLSPMGYYRIKYELTSMPLISIIIPNKDNIDILENCIKSILEKSTYENYEIIIVENNSIEEQTFQYYKTLSDIEKIRVLNWNHEFNYSKINNYAVTQSKGEYILLLNNDTEVITEDWMEQMLGNCMRKEVGIVGAKLYYPDNTIQHAGVLIGAGAFAGHFFTGLERESFGYFSRAFVQQNLSAVTAACLMTSRTIYDQVGGFEEGLRVAFNDIDFCLKVREKDYTVVYLADVELYHYESKSRGKEDTSVEKSLRFEKESEYMKKKWKKILTEGDPYYNPNLSLNADYSLKIF